MTITNKTENILDKIIFGFIILFLVTLHNSIFLNQIGYYGALLLIIAKAVTAKKSPFHRTGFEGLFLLFIAAEIVSAILSINPGNAFHNVLKRALLIPIVYIIFFAADNRKKAVTFFKVYLTAALITLSVYLVFAYEHFIHQLYHLETKGPSPFQYVMTAGGLISFCVIFLFAFLINEKTAWKYRVAILFAFILTLLALAASYTRAAWIGAAAGLFFILILKRKWLVVVPAVLLFSGFLIMQKTYSLLIIEDPAKSHRLELKYPGKFLSLYAEENSLYLSAYEKGILLQKDSNLVPVINTNAPVTYFSKWKEDYYFAFLVDHRIEVYRKGNGGFTRKQEIISAGINGAYTVANEILYVADKDSGLSVYTDPGNPGIKFRYPEYKGISRLAVDSGHMVFFAGDSLMEVIKLNKGLPSSVIYQKNYQTKFGFLFLKGNYFLFTTEKNTTLFKIENDRVIIKDVNTELNNINSFNLSENGLFASGFKKTVLELEYPFKDNLQIIGNKQLPFNPTTFITRNNQMIYTNVNVSRLNSIFDPYHQTNIQRLYQWQVGIAILRDHPIFGVGDIDMKKVYTEYMNYYEKETFGHLHNNYIQLLAALGIFGFTIVLILLVKIGITHFKVYKALRNIPFASSYALGAFGTFTGFLISGLAEWNFGDHEIITMVWFILGLNLAFFRNFKQMQEPEIKQEYVNE